MFFVCQYRGSGSGVLYWADGESMHAVLFGPDTGRGKPDIRYAARSLQTKSRNLKTQMCLSLKKLVYEKWKDVFFFFLNSLLWPDRKSSDICPSKCPQHWLKHTFFL